MISFLIIITIDSIDRFNEIMNYKEDCIYDYEGECKYHITKECPCWIYKKRDEEDEI